MSVNPPRKFTQEADAKGWPGTKLMRAAIKYAESEGHVFRVSGWRSK